MNTIVVISPRTAGSDQSYGSGSGRPDLTAICDMNTIGRIGSSHAFACQGNIAAGSDRCPVQKNADGVRY